jgi:hypothetical protein
MRKAKFCADGRLSGRNPDCEIRIGTEKSACRKRSSRLSPILGGLRTNRKLFIGLDPLVWGHPFWGTHKKMTEMNEQELHEFMRLKHQSYGLKNQHFG